MEEVILRMGHLTMAVNNPLSWIDQPMQEKQKTATETVNSPDTSKLFLKKIVNALIAAIAFIVVIQYFQNTRNNQPKAPELNILDAVKKEGLYYSPGQSDPFTGNVVDFYEDGPIKSRTQILSGQLHGVSEGWFKNGQLQIREHFKEGVAHGERLKWREDGSKESEGEVVDGELEGTFRKWHPNGQLAQEIEMKNGKPHGLSQAWHESGELKAKVQLDMGEVVEQEFFDAK